MESGIIIAILIIVSFIGIRSTVKHFAGKSGCCGSDYKHKKRNDPDIRCI